jgi:hypothetical protein
MTQNTAVIGHALYLEFKNEQTVYQMIFLPPANTSLSRSPFTIFRRQLSPAVSRKSWRSYTATGSSASEFDMALEVSKAREVSAGWVSQVTDNVMTQLVARGWKLYKEPIVVELTKDDVDTAQMGKIPYKALGRITKVRKRLGFEDFWKRA